MSAPERSDRDTLLSVLRELVAAWDERGAAAFTYSTGPAGNQVNFERIAKSGVEWGKVLERARAVLARADSGHYVDAHGIVRNGEGRVIPADEQAEIRVSKLPGAAGEAGAPEPCCMCKQIPDSPVSSGNPAMTICRECWVRAGASGGQGFNPPHAEGCHATMRKGAPCDCEVIVEVAGSGGAERGLSASQPPERANAMGRAIAGEASPPAIVPSLLVLERRRDYVALNGQPCIGEVVVLWARDYDALAGAARAGEERPSGPWKVDGPWRSGDPERGGFVYRFYVIGAAPGKRFTTEDLREAEAVRDALNRVAAGERPSGPDHA